MRSPAQLLAQTGVVVGVAVAVFGVAASPAAAFNSPEIPGRLTEVGLGRPTPDGPVETQIEQAIEELNQEGQDALAELGELDTPEKIERTAQILKHMELTSHEIRKRAHDSASDRFDELNDLAMGRMGDEARARLKDLGDTDTPEKQARADAIRARNAEIKARLEERWKNHQQRVAQRRSGQRLPRANFRLPHGKPPLFAAANGLRRQLENLTQEQAEEAIAQLERDGRNASERLGKLDTPGKIQLARKMQARLAQRVQGLRRHMANQPRDTAGAPRVAPDTDHAKDRFEEHAQALRHRAEAAINELGELDTPEKRERARHIKAMLDEALAALREQRSNSAHMAFEERLDREILVLRRRAEAALEELGELDTPEKQEKARRIQARLAEKVQKLREQLARRSTADFQEGPGQDSGSQRMDIQAALKEMGRLDTPEKVRRAQLIRARMEKENIRLRNRHARAIDGKSGPRLDALSDFLENRGPGDTAARMRHLEDGKRVVDPRNRAELARQSKEKAMNALRQQRDAQARIDNGLKAEEARARAQSRARQAITQKPHRPDHTRQPGTRPEANADHDRKVEPTNQPEPVEAEPVGSDSRSDSNSSGRDSGGN